MAWYSVLPSHLTVYETWIIRTFIVLAIINIAPWTVLILYDLLLWVFRAVVYEFPVYGGRAQGHVRPRAPSLVERNRRMSIAGLMSGASVRQAGAVETQTQTQTGTEDGQRRPRLRDASSKASDYAIVEEVGN